jgi:hypothetical protein
VSIHSTNFACIKLDDFITHRFDDKSEYDKSFYSSAYHERESKAGRGSNWEFDSEPTQFPCIGIEIRNDYRSDSRDKMIMLWLYEDASCTFKE